MRDWKIKMVQIHKRTAELADNELDDQYVEEMAEI
jgi:hypothetical protein